MLEVQHVGAGHLSTEPTIRPTVEITKPQKFPALADADGSKASDVPPSQRIVGFVHPKHDEDDEDDDDEDSESDEDQEVSLFLFLIEALTSDLLCSFRLCKLPQCTTYLGTH